MDETGERGDLDRFWTALADRYVVERPLGAGGMAVVYLARDVRHDRPVAIKVLRPDVAQLAHGERFAREIRIVARFAHPHILSVFDSGEADGHPYFVMPYVEGESLRARLEREGRLSMRDAVRLGREIADALHYAHEHGVVHRDIKPENILLESGHAVVADFGIARVMSTTDGRMTTVGMTLGTPAYMSPEQITGEGVIDRRTDIYSLGCVMFEMLAGRSPFAGKTTQQMITGHVTQVPARVRELRPEVPPGIDAVVATALGKTPDERFATAGELGDALEAGWSGIPPTVRVVQAAQTAGAEAGETPSIRTSRASRFGAGAAVAALVAVLAVVLTRFPGLGGAAGAKTLDDNLLAVAPFKPMVPRLSLWEEGMMDLLSRNFDGAGSIRTVAPTVIMRSWQGRADTESAASLGRATGAGLVVFGQLLGMGADSVVVKATVYSVTSDSAISDFEVRGDAERMDEATDAVTVHVLEVLTRSRAIGATTVARPTLGTRNLAALKSFLQGEQLYRQNAFASARRHYEEAIELDTSFTLALRRMRGVLRGAGFSEFDSLSLAYALRAGRANRGLTTRDSLLVVADSLAGALPFLTGSVDDEYVARLRRRHEILTRASQRFAEDPEVWDELGEVRTHFGNRIGVPQQMALAAFERAIALDPRYGPAYYHAIELSLTYRSTDTTQRYLRDYQGVNPDDARFRVLAGVLERMNRPSAQLDDWLRTQPVSARWTVARMLARWPDSSETAIRMMKRLLAENSALGTEGVSASPLWLPRALLYRGHVREAAGLVDQTFAAAYPHRVVQLALFGGLVPDSARRLFTRWVESRDLSRVILTLPWWSFDQDTLALRRILQRCDSVLRAPRSPAQQVDARYGRTAALARLALAARDSAKALAYLADLPDSLVSSMWYFERFDRVRILRERGQYREAADILDAYPPTEYTLTVSEVIWWWERARLASRLGEQAIAVRGYTIVSRAWANADSSLRELAKQAKAALRPAVVAARPDSVLLAYSVGAGHIRPPKFERRE